jgi:hypothetical protein
VDDAGSYQRMRAAAARRERARRLRREAERASTEWPEFVPQVGLGHGALGEAQAADREMARLFAVRARKLAEFAASRPASADRAQGEPGAMSPERWERRPEVLKPVSEWATQEVSIAVTRSQPKADAMLIEALTVTQKLPGTLAALEAGMLTPDHLHPLIEHVAPIADDQLRAEIEAEVLRWVAARAGKRTITTPPQLREKVLRVVTRRDARDRAQQAIKALRARGVFRLPEDREGLGALGIVASEPEIAALQAALEAYADALDDPEDRRSRGEKMIGCLLDLVLRSGESGVPPVQVLLTLVAPLQTALGGDGPAELNGRTISAEAARQLLDMITGAGLGEGALAELRRLADPPDDMPAEPVDSDDRFAEWERQLADGELDEPDPMPDEVWRASVEARLASGEIDLELERELLDAQERWWREFEAGGHSDPDPPDVVHATETDDPPQDPLPTGGWWTDADRAVDDARAAQREAARPSAPTGPTPAAGTERPRHGWTPPRQRSTPWSPRPKPTGRRCSTCSNAPPAADWPSGRGSPWSTPCPEHWSR